MPKPYKSNPPAPSSAPAVSYVPVTKGDPLPEGPCYALLVGTAGTANLTGLDGVDRDNVPLVKGYNPLVVAKVRAGGSATDIWALYSG